MPTARLLSLFLACFASIGYEIALARFFALSSRSEHGYWVISIAVMGTGGRRRGGVAGVEFAGPPGRGAVRGSPPRLDIPRL